jgi:ATP-dependent Clp protease protease subunit
MNILHKENFENYAIKHLGITSSRIDEYKKIVSQTQTPAIIENRETRYSIMSVFDRLMADRIIFISGAIHNDMANIINAQLLYLDSVDNKDIQFYIDSPGGGCYAGLSIVSSIELCKSKVITGVNGIAASMGSVLLSCGYKGERTATRFSRVMLHQVSSGYSGNVQDIEISYNETKRINNELFDLLGEHCNKTPEQVKKDASRDLWLNAYEALEYGIIDKVLERNNKIITLENLHEVKK